MARDLIPPTSPAGRPAPDGTPNLIELPPEPARSPAEPAQRVSLGPSEFRNRFGFLLGALAGVVVAALLLLTAVVVTSGDSGSNEGLAADWSKWHPTDTSLDGGAAQIAEKVGAEYKHPNGQQLVLVKGGPLPDELDIALRPSTGKISVLDGPTVVYQLNGLGPNNSIKGGKPSPERLQVLHREALELALYTFRYLPEAEGVLAMLPPPPPKEDSSSSSTALATATPDPSQQTALFYRPGDLLPQLQVPLGNTVPAKAPTPDDLNAAEAKTIDQLTLSNKFLWSVQPSGGLLVLDRPS